MVSRMLVKCRRSLMSRPIRHRYALKRKDNSVHLNVYLITNFGKSIAMPDEEILFETGSICHNKFIEPLQWCSVTFETTI